MSAQPCKSKKCKAVCSRSFSCHHRLSFQTNFITHRGQGHAVWLQVDPQTLRRAFLISVIPAEDYNMNPWDKSLLVTERPSAVAVNQHRLLNYSFPVYSRQQVRDLCDECPWVSGRSGDRGSGGGARRDSAGDERRGREDSEETANLSDSGAVFALHAFNLNSVALNTLAAT